MLETDPRSDETNKGEHEFTGKKWGYRILIIVGYFVFFIVLGTCTIQVSHKAVLIKLLSIGLVILSSAVLIKVTYKMFRRQYQKYGFFCIVFVLLSFIGVRNEHVWENKLVSFMATPEFKTKQAEMLKKIENGILPYSSYEEARAYLFKQYPEVAEITTQIWIGQLMSISTGYMWVVLLIMYGVTGIRYMKRRRKDGIIIDAARNHG